MDFRFSEDQDSIRALAMQICEKEVTDKSLKDVEASGDWFHKKLWSELATAELLGVALPESDGGSGMGFVELCILLEQQGRTVAPVPLLASLVLGAMPVAEFGSDAQRGGILPDVRSGDLILTAAFTEAETLDPWEPATKAEPSGDGWKLTGEKVAVPAAHLAGLILVSAKTLDGRVGVFLVDPKSEGVTIERQTATTGEPVGLLILNGAEVQHDGVLGDLDRGEAIVRWTMDRAIVGLCAMEVGIGQRQLELTADHANKRKQFDKPIGAFQAVAQRAADAYIDLEAIRLTMWQAAWRLDQGMDATKEILVAKYWAADGGHRIGFAAQHIHGGVGVDRDYPLHRYYLLAKWIEFTFGGAHLTLERLGRALADMPPDHDALGE